MRSAALTRVALFTSSAVDPLAQAFRPGLVSPKHLRSQEIEPQCLGESLLRAARTEQKAAAGRWRLLLADSPGFCTACTESRRLIAFSGRRLGAERFVSFDRRAVRLLSELGEAVELL